MQEKINIAIVDDYPLFANSLAKYINDFDSISVSFVANSGPELLIKLELCNELPKVILLDYKMPVMDGRETTKELKKKFPSIKVLILSNYTDEFYIKEMLNVGADGYIFKSTEIEEFGFALNQVMDLGFYYNEETIEILDKIRSNGLRIDQKGRKDISDDEKKILQLLCKEFSSSEIAEVMTLSKRTIDNKISKLLQKTNSKNAKGLVMYAVRNRIVEIG